MTSGVHELACFVVQLLACNSSQASQPHDMMNTQVKTMEPATHEVTLQNQVGDDGDGTGHDLGHLTLGQATNTGRPRGSSGHQC